jgi:carboxyl-terminal processing protease
MSLLTPDRVLVGFAFDKKRVTKNLDSAKQGFRRFSQIPTSTKALWPLALKFAPTMLAKKPIVFQPAGLRKQPFHDGIVLLVDRRTASAAEMIVASARENRLAMIVGEKTATLLLSATSVNVGSPRASSRCSGYTRHSPTSQPSQLNSARILRYP